MIKKHTGFTLIEIMISLFLGIIVIGGALSIYISSIRGSVDISNSAQLNYDLNSTMQLMVNDIKRAGHWGGAIAESDAKENIFTIGTLNIQLRNFASPTTAADPANCIMYTYDADGDGVVDGNADGDLDDSDDDRNEFYGFRLNGNIIQMRLSGESTDDCDEDTATDTWTAITDNSKINITSLIFSESAIAADAGPPVTPALPALTQCLNVTTALPYSMTCAVAATTGNLVTGNTATEVRQINIVLTGQLVDEPSVTKVSTGTVRIRNDRVFVQ